MTKVEIFRKNGRIFGYSGKGHSGYSYEGNDIVCAAISTSMQSALIGLQEVLHLNPFFEINQYGMMVVKLSDNDMNNSGVDIVMNTMFIFLKELSRQYPKYIELVEV